MKKVKMLFLATFLLFSLLLNASNDYISSGDYYQEEEIQRQEIQLPADFNLETANQELTQAREEGNTDRANLLSLQINTYWLENRIETFDPAAHGTGETNGSRIGSIMYINNEENSNNNSPYIPYWFDDVRIDPRNGIRNTSLVSLSNGELYCISQYNSSGSYSVLIRRSTDGGVNWTTYWDYTFGSSTTGLSYSRLVECHDTLIISYVLNQTGGYRTWSVSALPGNTFTGIYVGGTSSGYVDARIYDYRICTDGAIYSSAYVYATWNERWGSGPYDSTRVMFARSNNLNVGTWEIGPDRLASTTIGLNNIFYGGTRIAHGSGGRIWIVAYLHPNAYPGTYDENIRGWYSSNYGATWGSTVSITSSTNGIDERNPSIAGSHTNNNWVCLLTSNDAIRNCYSTNNGTTWTNINWIAPDGNLLPDVWVDDNSTAFFGTSRRDLTSAEQVRYKRGDISSPSSWTGSILINDDVSNLSNSYGPSVAYNYATGDAIIAWTNYNSSTYSIWFDDESWSTGIEEENPSDIGNTTEIMNIIGNPCYNNINLRYNITIPGNVRITLHDVSGRTVSEFVNAFKEAGSYELNLEPEISSGVYYISINSLEGSETKQVMFIQ